MRLSDATLAIFALRGGTPRGRQQAPVGNGVPAQRAKGTAFGGPKSAAKNTAEIRHL
jgi:hypothetical protein